MVGHSQSKERLNKTLCFIVGLLNKHKIQDWFIGYGTLLGMVREQSCIDNDDDIDIVCNQLNQAKIKTIMLENGFKVDERYISKNFIKFNHTEYASVDFYCAKVIGNDFYDEWEKMVWANCYPLKKIQWKKVEVQLPNEFIQKLIGRYGDWKTPQKSKGLRPTFI